ncbi:MAG: LacI family DNA-binding transcriptional regulator [Thermomicrobiales bacterium]|nr:LacI family DNA-binding transcriptional regulator [Thermomicrobiales bacterium]
MATIRDVASHAGVSTATVSRVVSGRGHVSLEARERVLAAVAELGYVPNALARGLKTRRSRSIGLLIPELVDPFYLHVAQAVEDVASAAGFRVILGNSNASAERERTYVDLMLAHNVDGVVFGSLKPPRAAVRILQEKGTPTVLIDEPPLDLAVDSVRGDNVGGARALTRHLLAQGHRRIALLNGLDGALSVEERERGFRQAMAEAGAPVDETLISRDPWTLAAGERRAATLLDIRPRVTAIFTGSWFLGIGALRALEGAGCAVPDDVAVATFDDAPFAESRAPFLTAAAQPVHEIGALATRMLLDRITGRECGPPREEILPTHLIVRASSAIVSLPASRGAARR